MGNWYIALIHHPVLDRSGKVVTSSVTSLDLHDLARAARTYGVAGTFVVHPSAAQRRFITNVVDHFISGAGRRVHPERGETLKQQIGIVSSLGAAVESIEAREGHMPLLVGTSARDDPGAAGFDEVQECLQEAAGPGLILFGTSWGLAPEVMDRLDFRLPPIRGKVDTEYNHLSVRAAVAVVLDRLLGDREPSAPRAADSRERE
ncbi:RNA methyltransferase [Nitrospinota bacterium]